jgi:PAS domain S-box-containing protein
MNDLVISEGDESKRRLEGIVASAMDAIITINEDQCIVLFNPAAEQMFGVSTDEALGQPISRFIPERYRAGHDEHIQRFRKTGVTGRRMGALGAISGLRADATEFPIEASISQVDIGSERLATVILRDITERLANEEARLLLAREVDHRAKNALAVVQALVSLTTAPNKEDFITAVRGRVAALGRAHSLLAQNRWKGGDLEQIITDETSAYCKPGQVRARGPKIALMPNAVQPISLLIHELATNAVKHGSLSKPGGRVDVSWHIRADEDLNLHWVETGEENVVAPSSQGFGSTLIETVSRQIGGEVRTDWLATGLRVTAALPPSNYKATLPEQAATGHSARVGRSSTAGRILIVEDELLVGMEMSHALSAEGWEVMGPVGTVEEAFELLAGDLPPDAAILDINLNGQMVYPVADLLRNRGIPYLFCSGYEVAPTDQRYQSSTIIKKPTNLQHLVSELTHLMNGPDGPGNRQAA